MLNPILHSIRLELLIHARSKIQKNKYIFLFFLSLGYFVVRVFFSNGSSSDHPNFLPTISDSCSCGETGELMLRSWVLDFFRDVTGLNDTDFANINFADL
jgi:cell shape-determining protein MreC